MYPFPDWRRRKQRSSIQKTYAMKKLLIVCVSILLTGSAALAQSQVQAPASGTVPEHAGSRWGSQFAQNAVRFIVNISPNPMGDRTLLDAGGAVIRHIVIRNRDVNAVRFHLERPGLEPGLHLVEVVTDFGTRTVKLMVQ
jgi:hypothetical protein